MTEFSGEEIVGDSAIVRDEEREMICGGIGSLGWHCGRTTMRIRRGRGRNRFTAQRYDNSRIVWLFRHSPRFSVGNAKIGPVIFDTQCERTAFKRYFFL